MSKEIRVESIDRKLQVYKPVLVKSGKKLSGLLKLKKPIDVFLVDPQAMRKMNRKYRKKDKSTNVLSFISPPGFPSDSLGEVYLDPRYIEKKGENLIFMLIHGVLHILGYDHEKERDRISMERKEKQLLSKLRKANL